MGSKHRVCRVESLVLVMRQQHRGTEQARSLDTAHRNKKDIVATFLLRCVTKRPFSLFL